MNKPISLIITAFNGFGDFATPYVNSILKYESNIEIILVDNGSPKPYKESPNYKLVRLEQPKVDYNYAQALNVGADAATGDWFLFSNDDVLCKGKFSDMVEALPINGLYGTTTVCRKMSWGAGRPIQHLYGWVTVMHRSVFEKVGRFDEHYIESNYDDIDYSWRAEQAGFPLRVMPFPFVHLADLTKRPHRRTFSPHFIKNCEHAKKYFIEKVNAK